MSKLLSRFGGSKKDLTSQELKCAIRLLDDDDVLHTTFQREHKGQYLLDYVFKSLNLLEKDYFGLRYVDEGNVQTRYWLDPTRSIVKQVKSLNPIIFCFRVKFYPADPHQLKEEISRYYLYLQLRRDLLNRRLYCLPADATYLIACVIQSELGDYDPEEHKGNYIADLKLIPSQNEKIEMEAIEIHQNELRNQTPAEAELHFLERASKLETYGIDPHQVKDQQKNALFIGINYSGILAFQSNRKVYHFKWNELQKITYEGKMFIVHYLANGKKNLIGFRCNNAAACTNLWRCAVEQRYFFTMNSSLEIPSVTTGGTGFLFAKQCKLRYSGRVEREIIEDMKKVNASGGSSAAGSVSTINRRHSINSNVPLSMRSIGRSNTAPLPNNESPDFNSSIYQDKNPYLNYSTVSEPHHAMSGANNNNSQNHHHQMMMMEVGSESLPALQHNYSSSEQSNSRGGGGYNHYGGNTQTIVLDKFDEEEWEASAAGGGTGSNLPTEFDLRPDLTPTGEEPPNAGTISFETPVVRSSPSQLSRGGGGHHGGQHHHHHRHSEEDDEATSDSDETLEQVSEIVDQTPSTYQQSIGGSGNGGGKLFTGSNRNNAANSSNKSANAESKKSSSAASSSATAAAKMSCGKRMLAVLATSVLSALIILLTLTCLLVLVLETDVAALETVRRLPEMVIFSRDYYQPFKEGLLQWWSVQINGGVGGGGGGNGRQFRR